MDTQAIVVMGVSGSGKSTFGAALAEALGWEFYDADDYHPEANVAKMAAGNPLNDADRAPWLAILHDLIASNLQNNQPMILACSALKQSYRDTLLEDNPNTDIIYLNGSFETIWQRMQARANHFMRPEMLQSQFDTLEEPTDVFNIPVDASTGQQVALARTALAL